MDTTKISLTVKNIKKTYSRREVVSDVSFSVNSGEIVGLLGPNGAGKTTCFYITCGLVKQDAGKVFINDHDVTKVPMHQRALLGLGYLPQEPSIFRKLSVEDNIMALLELNKNLDDQSRIDNLESLLDEFKIGHIRKSMGKVCQVVKEGEQKLPEPLLWIQNSFYWMSHLLELTLFLLEISRALFITLRIEVLEF